MIGLYDRLLGLLPETFRDEYGPELRDVVRAQHAEVAAAGLARRAVFWIRQLRAVALLALGLRMGWGPHTRRVHNEHERNAQNGATMTTGWMQDLRHSIRALAKQPGFTAVTVLTLAIGIGASTSIFSAVHAVLLRDLAYAEADRIVAVFQENTATRERSTGVSAANMRDLAESSTLLSSVGVADPWSLDLQLESSAESLRAWSVTDGFLDAIGARPFLGRAFAPEEYAQDGPNVVLLGHRSWTNRYGADPSIVGTSLLLDGEAHTVVGVLPAEFKYPDEVEVWIPRAHLPWDPQSRGADYMSGVARLAPGVTLAQAQAEADRIAASLAESHAQTNTDVGFRLVPLREHLFGAVTTPLLILFGAVAFVLLIACANVAGLQLARGSSRQREYAVRGALGAGTARLTRHVAIESLLLAAVGCALGVALTYAGVAGIRALGPDHLPRVDELGVNGVVLVFAVLIAGASAFISGLAPAAAIARTDLRVTLSDGSRGMTGGRGRASLRSKLVVLEIGAALVLLVGAGLLAKSFNRLTSEELGFDPTGRAAVQVFAYGYPEGETQVFVDQSIQGMEAIPGVRDVALTTNVPGATDASLASIDIDLPFTIVGRATPAEGQEPIAWLSQVSDGYFDLMDIPVVDGRGFDTTDRPESAPVVVVNSALVRRHFPSEDAVGQIIRLPSRNSTWVELEVVGVVGDVRPLGYESEARPEVYLPLSQAPSGSLTFVIAGEGNPGAFVQPAMEAIWTANPAQSVWGGTTLEGLLGEWLKERRFNMLLLSGFALAALLLSAIGMYGLVSFSVEQRVPELGIRRALGGASSAVLGMMLREGAMLALAGIALGVLGALALTRFLQGMLFGVEATDPVTFVWIATAVLFVTVLATLVPAARAARVDPMTALRDD